MVPSEFSCCSNTGKVIFEWCKQVADNRDAPWSAQEPLPCQSAHVGNIRIVDWEAKDPDGETSQTTRFKTSRRTDGRKIILRFWPLKEMWQVVSLVYIPLHLSAPEDVFLLVHVDREVLVLALLDGIRPGGDGPHLVKLTEKKGKRRNISPWL